MLGKEVLQVIAKSILYSVAIIATCGGHCVAKCDSYSVEQFNGPFCQFTGFTGATPQSINEDGTITGLYNNCNFDERAFRWSTGPIITALPTTPGLYSARAYDINSSDQIVGTRDLISGPIVGRRGYLFQNGTYLDLGNVLNSTEVEALAINNSAQVCGYSNNANEGPLRAFLWQQGRMQALTLPLGKHAVANDLNNNSEIVGWMGDLPGRNAFLWRDGVGSDLGRPEGAFAAEAMRISDAGHIGGRYLIEIAPGVIRRRGFHWKNGVFTDLGLLPQFDTVDVRGINDRGEIVGWCEDSRNEIQSRPFIWRDGVMTDLNDLTDLPPNVVIDFAWDINNQGQIAADGRVFEKETTNVGFRLTPRSKVEGDYDCDHLVDVQDLLGVLRHWGPSNGPADFNRDQTVNTTDLLTVIQNWTR